MTNGRTVFKGENEVIEIDKNQQNHVESNKYNNPPHNETDFKKCTVTEACAVSLKINSACVKETIPLRRSSRTPVPRKILDL